MDLSSLASMGVSSKVQIAVAREVLDAQRDQGAAAAKLIRAARASFEDQLAMANAALTPSDSSMVDLYA